MTSASEPDYLPFTDGPYRMAMGLMALKPADWIEIDGRYAEEIALRRSLLVERCCEVLDQLAGFLPERFPDRFERAGTGRGAVQRCSMITVSPDNPQDRLCHVHDRFLRMD